jgi:hypothetical protein
MWGRFDSVQTRAELGCAGWNPVLGRDRQNLAQAQEFPLFFLSYSLFKSNSNLNFNFPSAKMNPNINFTVYNIIIINSFPYYLFMGGTNGFIKIPFLMFLFKIGDQVYVFHKIYHPRSSPRDQPFFIYLLVI